MYLAWPSYRLFIIPLQDRALIRGPAFNRENTDTSPAHLLIWEIAIMTTMNLAFAIAVKENLNLFMTRKNNAESQPVALQLLLHNVVEVAYGRWSFASHARGDVGARGGLKSQALKFHGTIRIDDFQSNTGLQYYCEFATLFRKAATLFQHCNTMLC